MSVLSQSCLNSRKGLRNDKGTHRRRIQPPPVAPPPPCSPHTHPPPRAALPLERLRTLRCRACAILRRSCATPCRAPVSSRAIPNHRFAEADYRYPYCELSVPVLRVIGTRSRVACSMQPVVRCHVAGCNVTRKLCESRAEAIAACRMRASGTVARGGVDRTRFRAGRRMSSLEG